MRTLTKIQIGKSGLTKEFIEDLKKRFENKQNIKVSVLKSAFKENPKKEVREITDKILKELGEKFTARIIGHTIALKKWRKVQN
jgi:RNA-binding protein YhbY